MLHERPARSGKTTRRPLFVDRATLAGSEACAADIADAVDARRCELRQAIADALASGDLGGKRRAQLLAEIEHELVKKWQWSPDRARFEANVAFVDYGHRRLARKWLRELDAANDDDSKRRLLVQFSEVTQLSQLELHVYRACRDGDDDDKGDDESVPACYVVIGAGVLCVAIVGLLAFYLVNFSTGLGPSSTRVFITSALFDLALYEVLVLPLHLFCVMHVAPQLLQERLALPRPQQYPFQTPLPLVEDALDHLLILDPALRALLPPDCARDASPRQMPADGERGSPTTRDAAPDDRHLDHQLSLERLSTMNINWARFSAATLTLAIALMGVFFALPEFARDILFEETTLGLPLVAMLLWSNTNKKSLMRGRVIAAATFIISLILAALVVTALRVAHLYSKRRRDQALAQDRELERRLSHASSGLAVGSPLASGRIIGDHDHGQALELLDVSVRASPGPPNSPAGTQR